MCVWNKWIATAWTSRSFPPRRFFLHTTASRSTRSSARSLFNDAALKCAIAEKEDCRALCQVPLQDIDASCAELTRCMRAGHLGVEIGNHVGEKNLDDPGHRDFSRTIARTKAPPCSFIPGT